MKGLRLSVLLAPGVAGVLFTAVLVAAAYQVRVGMNVELGAPTDSALLDGFNGPERVPPTVDLGYRTFRWMTGYGTATFRDVGIQPYDVTLTVNGSRPAGQPPPLLTVAVGTRRLLDVRPGDGLHSYTFTVPRDLLADGQGSFTLQIAANSFKIPGDSRELGIIVTHIEVASAPDDTALVGVPGRVWGSLTAASALLAFLLGGMGWGGGAVALGACSVGALAGGLLVWERLWLTVGAWYSQWLWALLLGGIVTVLLWVAGGWVLRRAGAEWSGLERRALLTITLLAFVVRLAGELHPQIFMFDLGFHLNRLHLVEEGQLLFTTQPAEFGGFGHSTFYLPTPYIFALPLNWLLGDERNALRVLTVLLGSLGTLPLFYIAGRLLRSGPAGLFGAGLYVCLPIAVLPYSWGITSNVFGDFFALLALAMLVGALPLLHPMRAVFWIFTAVLFVALLSHPGVTAFFGVAFTVTAGLWRLRWKRAGPGQARGAAWAFAALALAGALAFLVYYRHFTGQMLDSIAQIGAERASAGGAEGFHRIVGGSVEDTSLGLVNREVFSRRDWVLGGIEGLWREAAAYYRTWPVFGALLGLSLAWPARRVSTAAGRTAQAMACWLGVGLLFSVFGWATGIYIRYMLAVLPVVALAVGLLLALIRRRGPAGMGLSLLVMVFFAAQALILWHYRISYAFK